jgi:cytochrome P450 family 6
LRFNIAGLSVNSLAAQAFVFYLGGFETSSTTMTFCLYELSLHQDIQDRVREEIDVVLQKHDGKITYESIQEMEYLDKVVSGEIQLLKSMSNTRINLQNNATSLGHVSLLDINLQSILIISTYQYPPVNSPRDLFSYFVYSLSLNFNVVHIMHTAFRI